MAKERWANGGDGPRPYRGDAEELSGWLWFWYERQAHYTQYDSPKSRLILGFMAPLIELLEAEHALLLAGDVKGAEEKAKQTTKYMVYIHNVANGYSPEGGAR